jgi:hypothetical protein
MQHYARERPRWSCRGSSSPSPSNPTRPADYVTRNPVTALRLMNLAPVAPQLDLDVQVNLNNALLKQRFGFRVTGLSRACCQWHRSETGTRFTGRGGHHCHGMIIGAGGLDRCPCKLVPSSTAIAVFPTMTKGSVHSRTFRFLPTIIMERNQRGGEKAGLGDLPTRRSG